VHAETTEATDFHLHLVLEFEVSPTDELHLFLLMKDLRNTLGCHQPNAGVAPQAVIAPGRSPQSWRSKDLRLW